jgi:hypothetical protein
MNAIVPPVALLTATGAAAALLTTIARGYNQPAQRLRRGLRQILGDAPQTILMTPSGERGVGFDFRSNRLAIAWDTGAWGLIYALDELSGAEILVDGEVAGFAYPGGARWRRREAADGPQQFVGLRLVFHDAANPDFILDLWRRGPDRSDRQPLPQEALDEASHWLARIEALLNRPHHSWWEAAPTSARRAFGSAQPERRTIPAFRLFADDPEQDAVGDDPIPLFGRTRASDLDRHPEVTPMRRAVGES